MTPNLLARTTETVEGGGLIVLLLRSMASLRQLYTLSMDVHARYRTEAHQDVVGRFNERLVYTVMTILGFCYLLANLSTLQSPLCDGGCVFCRHAEK